MLACCCTGPGRQHGRARCEACLRPQLGGQDPSCGLSTLLGGVGMICPARHFGCLRGGAFRGLVKGGIPSGIFHLPLNSCPSSQVLPAAQGGRRERRLLLSTISHVPLPWAPPQLLKLLLSPTRAHVSPFHWILYPCVCVHKNNAYVCVHTRAYVHLHVHIYTYKLCIKGRLHCCGGCCPYVCGLSQLVCLMLITSREPKP